MKLYFCNLLLVGAWSNLILGTLGFRGGQQAAPGQFPYLVAGQNGTGFINYLGTLIADDVVLIPSFYVERVKFIVIGCTDFYDDSTCHDKVAVKRTEVLNWQGFLTLERPVKEGFKTVDFVVSEGVFTEPDELFPTEATPVTTTGLHFDTDGNLVIFYSERLIPVDKSTCADQGALLDGNLNDTRSFFCAGFHEEGPCVSHNLAYPELRYPDDVFLEEIGAPIVVTSNSQSNKHMLIGMQAYLGCGLSTWSNFFFHVIHESDAIISASKGFLSSPTSKEEFIFDDIPGRQYVNAPFPEEWTCGPIYYDTLGVCYCFCGMPDPDCYSDYLDPGRSCPNWLPAAPPSTEEGDGTDDTRSGLSSGAIFGAVLGSFLSVGFLTIAVFLLNGLRKRHQGELEPQLA